MSAPRLVTRALVLSFLTVALMLGAVFTVLSVGVRDQVRQKAALDTWLTERAGASAVTTDELLMTVQREIDKIAGRVSASVLAVADGKGAVVVSGGRQASSWPRGSTIGAAFQ